MALRVKEDNFDIEVLKADIPVIVEFYSDSCVPCKQMSVVLSELEDEFEDMLKIVKVNVNFSPDLAEQHQVMASPTLLYFKDGKELKRMSGLTKKAVIQEIIKDIL